jgi:selenocysteine lyase/cysteine desulfurase
VALVTHPRSTAAYESTRTEIGSFVGARPDDVVLITRNTTDALNLLATAVPGAVVHLDIEHHANLLPWQAQGGRVVEVQSSVAATLAAVEDELCREPAALVTVTGASNVTGECLPVESLADIAHRCGARLAVDGASLHRIDESIWPRAVSTISRFPATSSTPRSVRVH